ncbi:MAG: MogA/MoaB family molybdenum cofactor biosynthesis protein [Haloferacaceae archaeon]
MGDTEETHDRDSHDHDDHAEHGSHDDHHEHGSHDDHHEHADADHHRHDLETLGVAVITVTTTRDPDEDPSGDLIVDLFEDAGHEIADRQLIPDDHDLIQGMVNNLVDRRSVDVVVTTGGTGVTPDDVTPDAIEPLLDKPLPGFGELFRRLSYEEIGTMVVATRAIGGVVEDVPVFALPGSTDAVRLGVEEIILPEAGHLAGLAGRIRE